MTDIAQTPTAATARDENSLPLSSLMNAEPAPVEASNPPPARKALMDKHLERLDKFSDEIFGLAMDCVQAAKAFAGDSDGESAVKQATSLVSTYAKLVSTSDRHRQAIREEE